MYRDDLIQYSEFDSEIFNKKVGRVSVSGVNHELVTKIRKEGDSKKFEIIFVQDNECDYTELNNIKSRGFNLSDIKVRLINSKLPSSVNQHPDVYLSKNYSEEDFASLYKIVSQIALLSQYNKLFGEEIALNLYEKWLINSLDYKVADICYFLREKRTDSAIGFIGIQIEKNISDITLVGLDQKFHGKGVSKIFMEYVLRDLHRNGILECSVGTQLQNSRALKFYNRMGFYFRSFSFDFVLLLY